MRNPEALPFRAPMLDDAPMGVSDLAAGGWVMGYTAAQTQIADSLVAECTHHDDHWGQFEPDKCPFGGCAAARLLKEAGA